MSEPRFPAMLVWGTGGCIAGPKLRDERSERGADYYHYAHMTCLACVITGLFLMRMGRKLPVYEK